MFRTALGLIGIVLVVTIFSIGHVAGFYRAMMRMAKRERTVEHVDATNYIIGSNMAVWVNATAATNIYPSTNLINKLCADGEICRVKGHFWRDGRPGESDHLRYNDYHHNTSYRTCALCGTVQSQTREWK